MKKSKCCGAEIVEKENEMFGGKYFVCSKCGAFCETIEEVQNEEKGIHGNINIIDTSAVDGIDIATMSMKNEEYGRKDIEGENYLKLTLKMAEEEHNQPTPKEPEEWKEIDKILLDYCREIATKGKGEPLVRRSIRRLAVEKIQSLLSQKDKEWERRIKDNLIESGDLEDDEGVALKLAHNQALRTLLLKPTK